MKTSVYLVAYDIVNGDSFDYEPFFESLRTLHGKRILQTVWMVPARSDDHKEIYGRLQPFLNHRDRILVIEVIGMANWDKLLIEGDDFKLLMTKYARDLNSLQ